MDNKSKLLALMIVGALSLSGCGAQAIEPTNTTEPTISSEPVVSSKPAESPSEDRTSDICSVAEDSQPEGASSQIPVITESAPVESSIPLESTKPIETPKQQESKTSPDTNSSGTYPFGSAEHRQQIYEIEWLDESNSANTQFFETFDDYYDAYYVKPFESLGVPHIKTNDEKDAEAKRLREERLANRIKLEESAIKNIQSHWTEAGKTQAEIDARIAEWKADMKTVYVEIDAKETALLSQGLSLSEVEFEISSMESLNTYGADSGGTPEEAKAFDDAMKQGFDPIEGEANAN